MHEGLPDVGFDAPIHYHWLTEDQRRTRAMLSTDLCGIEQKGTKDRFVRGCLALPIKSSTEEFVWGVWVSLSERNFERYAELDGDALEGEGPWFGWLSGRRITLEPTDHPLAVHQREGIALDDLLGIVGPRLHRGGAADETR